MAEQHQGARGFITRLGALCADSFDDTPWPSELKRLHERAAPMQRKVDAHRPAQLRDALDELELSRLQEALDSRCTAVSRKLSYRLANGHNLAGHLPRFGQRTDPCVQLDERDKLITDRLERYLWSAADILRGSIDSSDYRNDIFGFLFLKRRSDRRDEEVTARRGDPTADLRVFTPRPTSTPALLL